jgi:glutamate racemase
MDTQPIGMFDSGVGGLTVLREVIKNNGLTFKLAFKEL